VSRKVGDVERRENGPRVPRDGGGIIRNNKEVV